MPGKMRPVVHFEMPADDRRRIADFYRRAFGWRTEMQGPQMGDYVLATTTETDEAGRPRQPGAINGGFYPRTPDWPGQHRSIVIAVDDVDGSIKDVSRGGGEPLDEPMEIPGVGQYVAFLDTEGNRVSMLEPLTRN